MQKIVLALGGALVLAVIAGLIYTKTPNPNFVDTKLVPPTEQTNTPSSTPTTTPYQTALGLSISSPLPNQKISSPLVISGTAPGNWFFEGSAPVKLLDNKGKTIATGTIETKEDWMTDKLVSFSGQLKFNKPTTSTGNLVLSKDNPSGLAKNNQEVSIPVNF